MITSSTRWAPYISVMSSWFCGVPQLHGRAGDGALGRRSCRGPGIGVPVLTGADLPGVNRRGREVQWRENFWHRLDGDRIVEDWEDYETAGILEQIS